MSSTSTFSRVTRDRIAACCMFNTHVLLKLMYVIVGALFLYHFCESFNHNLSMPIVSSFFSYTSMPNWCLAISYGSAGPCNQPLAPNGLCPGGGFGGYGGTQLPTQIGGQMMCDTIEQMGGIVLRYGSQLEVVGTAFHIFLFLMLLRKCCKGRFSNSLLGCSDEDCDSFGTGGTFVGNGIVTGGFSGGGGSGVSSGSASVSASCGGGGCGGGGGGGGANVGRRGGGGNRGSNNVSISHPKAKNPAWPSAAALQNTSWASQGGSGGAGVAGTGS